MKTLLILALIMAGCAGEYPVVHTGSVATAQHVVPPTPPRGLSFAQPGHVWNYLDAPTYGVFRVENGTDEMLDVLAMCVDGFEHELHVPPGRGQRILVTTTVGRARDGLCTLGDPR